jgi:hypothetical protein
MHRFELWRQAIQSAADSQAVARVMRDYVEGIPPDVVAALPAECQRALSDPDVQAAAITILHAELSYRGDSATAQLLHEIAHTHAAASMRIARLGGESFSGESGFHAARRTA